MNARLYDPVMGRMFSPDINIVDGGSLQGYNRYSYALNNPLRYTDPDGNNPLLVGLAVSAIYSALAYTCKQGTSGEGFKNWNWNAFGARAFVSGWSGAITSGIGGAFGPVGALGNEIGRAGAHGLSGVLFSEVSGGDPVAGFVSGALSSGIGSLSTDVSFFGTDFGGTLLASGVGGVSSSLVGGNFWTGAVNGASVHLLNQIAHKIPSYFVRIHRRYLLTRANVNFKYSIDGKGHVIIDKNDVSSFLSGLTRGLSYKQTNVQEFNVEGTKINFNISGLMTSSAMGNGIGDLSTTEIGFQGWYDTKSKDSELNFDNY